MTTREYNIAYNDGVQHSLILVMASASFQMVADDHPLRVVLKELIEKISKLKKPETNNNEW